MGGLDYEGVNGAENGTTDDTVNILFGMPVSRSDDQRVVAMFLSSEGKHVVCGGTTASTVAEYLGKPLNVTLNYEKENIPPIGEIEGVDLVTEGVITMGTVAEYARDYLGKRERSAEWSTQNDGASLICRLIFGRVTEINFYVGRAENPAHQDDASPINFRVKMDLVEEISKSLKGMGKRVNVFYF